MVTKNTEFCTGCGVCAAVCPKKCLKIELNDDGFYIPYLSIFQADGKRVQTYRNRVC